MGKARRGVSVFALPATRLRLTTHATSRVQKKTFSRLAVLSEKTDYRGRFSLLTIVNWPEEHVRMLD